MCQGSECVRVSGRVFRVRASQCEHGFDSASFHINDGTVRDGVILGVSTA